jgi:hypothetical protein
MATDQILSEILIELQRLNASNGGGSGGGGSGGGGSGASSAVGASLAKVAGLIGKLGDSVMSTMSTIVNLGKTAADGASSLSSVTTALSGLPGPLGKLASAATFAADMLEKNLKVQEDLSKSGATFGGNLDLMRQSAASAHLGLDEFASAVKKNATIFSTMGGNVQDGLKQFVAIQNNLMAPGSDIQKNLSSLGISAAEAGDLTASYMRSQGSMNKSGLQDAKATAAAVQTYAQELTMLSSITGKSREEIQKKMDEENAEAQWTSLLASMGADKADKMRQGIQMSMMQGGQGAVDAFKSMARGLPPMTEAAQMYTATQHAGVDALTQYNQRANDAGVSVKENADANRKTLAKQIADGGKDRESFNAILQADAAAGGKLAESFKQGTITQNSFMKEGKMRSEAEILASLEEADKKSKITASQASDGATLKLAFQELTNNILAKMMPAFNFLLGVVLKSTDAVAKFIMPLLGKLDFAPLMSFLDEIFQSIDWETLGETLSGIMTTVMSVITSVASSLEPLMKQIVTVVNNLMPKLLPIFQDIGVIITRTFEVLSPLLTPIINGIEIVLGGLFTMLGGIIDIIKGLMTGNWKEVGTGLLDTVGGFIKGLYGIIKIIKDILVGGVRGIWNFFTGSTPDKVVEAPTAAPATPKATSRNTVEKSAPLKGKQMASALHKADEVPITGEDSVQSTTVATASSADTVSAQLSLLNASVLEMIKYLKETADHTRRNVDATKGLSGNLFA